MSAALDYQLDEDNYAIGPEPVGPSAKVIDLNAEMNPKFQRLLYNRKRWLVLWGGAGSGKSIFAAQKCVLRCMMKAGEKIGVTRKVARTLRQSVFATIKAMIYQWGVQGQWRINSSEKTFEYLPNGSQIILIGMDDPEKLKSIHGITSWWHEEPTELTQADLSQLNLRLRGETPSYKQHILTFNPISVLHWLRKFFFEEVQDPKRVTLHHSTFRDNVIGMRKDPDYAIELQALRDKDPQLADVYADGKWGVLTGLVYPAFDTVDAMPARLEDEFYSVDFGFNNPMVLLHNGVKDGIRFTRELVYERKWLTKHLIKFLKLLNIAHWVPIYCDAAEPDRIEEISQEGFNAIPANKGPGSVKAGIDHVKAAGIILTRDSVNMLRESVTYKYIVDKMGNVLDEPLKYMDHAMDALRYGWFTHDRAMSTTGKVSIL